MMILRALLLAFLLWFPSLATAKGGVVSAADPRAAAAGRDILRQGGSAADAALAMMLVLTVVEPQSSGIGGGGFMVYHDARRNRISTIDGRETAPSSASERLFLDESGSPMSFMKAVPGGRSVGVPGNIALLARAHAKWGKLPLTRVIAPAIRIAEDGFAVTPRLARALGQMGGLWNDFPAARAIYWQDGHPKQVGDIVRNLDLAAVLRHLAQRGPLAFYRGKNARAIITATSTSSRNPTAITPADLAAYRAKERPALCVRYRVYRICGMGPPSAGAVSTLQILGMLERFDLKAMGKDSPLAWHLISEAMRLAYADREQYLADGDFVAVPAAAMLDPAYVARRSALISTERALPAYAPGQPAGAPDRTAAIPRDEQGTTHFVAVDGAGNVASMTSTVEGPFGSQLVVNGYFLNNELTDFSFAPTRNGAPVANRVAPGKRPLSSMSPTIVYGPDGKPVFVLGAAGGKTIIMQVAKTLIAHLDWDLSAQDAIAAPNIYFAGDAVQVEAGTPLAALAGEISRFGRVVLASDMARLKANAAERTPQGWRGAADPRSEGVALEE